MKITKRFKRAKAALRVLLGVGIKLTPEIAVSVSAADWPVPRPSDTDPAIEPGGFWRPRDRNPPRGPRSGPTAWRPGAEGRVRAERAAKIWNREVR